jgi:hypothetical protein
LPDPGVAIHTAAPMALARLLRAVLVAGVWLAVLTVARPAHAAWAPLCDDRGASALAPPPLLQAPEDVITRASNARCDRDAASLLSTLRRGHERVDSPDPDGDAALPAATIPVLLQQSRSATSTPAREIERPPSAMRARVERPPRG